MSKHKKKTSQASLQKIDEARQRNDFIARLGSFCDQVAGPGIFQLIPEKDLNITYLIRCRPVKVEAAPGQKASPSMLKEAQWTVNQIFKRRFIPIEVGEVKDISLYDFFTTCFTLLTYESRLRGDDYPKAHIVKKALAPLASIGDSEVYNRAWREFNSVMYTLAMFYSDISTGFYAIKSGDLSGAGKNNVHFSMQVYYIQAEKIQVKVDGINRPVARLAWGSPIPDIHLDFITINSTALDLPKKKSFDVYIQSHALNRLLERMDGIDAGFLHYNLFDSFKNLKFCKNKKGELLFEYRFFGTKTGYFVGDIIDDYLILRTFLFLTSNGTPEGEKLHATTGLMKADKIYLAIDKLSTFINSDIATNEQIKEIFVKAGCESLIMLDKNMHFPSDDSEKKNVAEKIARYLNLDDTPPTIVPRIN